MGVLAIALKSNDGIKAYKLVNALKHLLDQYADDLTLYLERSEVHSENTKNVKAVLDTLENFRLLSCLTVNRGKTMLTIFGRKETDISLCKQPGIKWCTEFKLLCLWFDQTLENMKKNYDLAKKKVLAVANSWRNRYVSVYGKVCVVKTLMLPKPTHIATVLPTLKKKQIKEIEQIWYDYISPKKGAARADRKTIHAPTAAGGSGLHHLKEFWQALKVSWIRRLNTSRSFWMQILATQSAISVPTLRETDYLTVDVLMKCKRTKKNFWQETFNSYIKVRENFLAEYPNQRLLQLINGNNQLTLDVRPANLHSMHKKTLATTINPDLSIMTTNQYMRDHEEEMWIKKPKLRAEYIKYNKLSSA